MLGILAGDTLSLNSSAQGTLGCVGCGATLQAGPGRASKDGSLGSGMQTGSGRAFQDGALGSAIRGGSGRAYQDGVPGFVNISSDFLVGAAIAAAFTYFATRKR